MFQELFKILPDGAKFNMTIQRFNEKILVTAMPIDDGDSDAFSLISPLTYSGDPKTLDDTFITDITPSIESMTPLLNDVTKLNEEVAAAAKKLADKKAKKEQQKSTTAKSEKLVKKTKAQKEQEAKEQQGVKEVKMF